MQLQKEWQAALSGLKWLRAELDRSGRYQQVLLVVGDGSYDKAELWRKLPERVVLLVRTARGPMQVG